MKKLEQKFLEQLRTIGIELSDNVVCSINRTHIEIGLETSDKRFNSEPNSQIVLYSKNNDNETRLSINGLDSFDPSNKGNYWKIIHSASILKNWTEVSEIVDDCCREYDLYQALDNYNKILIEENEKEIKNKENILNEIKKIVDSDYLESIIEFIEDKENGIWGGLKIVTEPIGEYQEEYQDDDESNYWNVLKGMWVNQSCGYSGDDYNGSLEIKLKENLFLRCSFSL